MCQGPGIAEAISLEWLWHTKWNKLIIHQSITPVYFAMTCWNSCCEPTVTYWQVSWYCVVCWYDESESQIKTECWEILKILFYKLLSNIRRAQTNRWGKAKHIFLCMKTSALDFFVVAVSHKVLWPLVAQVMKETLHKPASGAKFDDVSGL